MSRKKEPTAVDRLLAEGRALLATRDEQDNQAYQQHLEKLKGAFRQARVFAVGIFGQVAEDLTVLPTMPDPDWDIDLLTNKLTFHVLPFGNRAGAIEVNVQGQRLADGLVWALSGKDAFHVGVRFSHTDEYVVYPSRHEKTSLISVALALCEQAGPAYRQAVARAKRAKALAGKADRLLRRDAPEQKLLAALREWHKALPHATVDGRRIKDEEL